MEKTRWLYLFGFLALIATSVWFSAFSVKPQNMRLIACDVGQGDAILAVYGETQILVDGGPGKKVLDCLSKYLPFYDRTIEVVILTHPQLDHYEGLIEVFQTYEVKVLVANSLESSSQSYQVLKSAVGGSGARVVSPDSSLTIRLGLMHLDILHPSEQFLLANTARNENQTEAKVLGAYTTKKDPNDFSVVAILSLGEFDALLTGDIGPEIVDSLLGERLVKPVEYIKIPHHGSRNGLTEELLEIVKPEVAIISAGEKNRYGHPHKEVLEMLERSGIRTLGTYELGDVVIETDGETWGVVN